MKTKKISVKDVEVIKGNDRFTNDEMAKILGGTAAAELGCVCKCGTNTASMASGGNDDDDDDDDDGDMPID